MEFLIKLRNELKVPKGKYNSHGKFKYRSCEDILQAVKPLLLKHNVMLTLTDDVVLIGDRYYVKSTASVTDGEKNYKAVGFAREQESRKGMSADQITGSTSSYSRKYALNALFLLDESEAEADHQPAEDLTDDLVKTIEDLITKSGSDKEKFKTAFSIKEIGDLNASQYKRAVMILNKKIKDKK